jgi:hypothetical protein
LALALALFFTSLADIVRLGPSLSEGTRDWTWRGTMGIDRAKAWVFEIMGLVLWIAFGSILLLLFRLLVFSFQFRPSVFPFFLLSSCAYIAFTYCQVTST